jgi:hypothetical protein
MRFNIDKLKQIVEELKNDLGDGFVATDIWATADAQPIVGFNSQPKAVALFNEVTRKLDKTLKGSDYAGLGNYYLVNLDNNNLVVVLSIGAYQQFILVNLSQTTMGILMNVALPNLLSGLAEAEDFTEAAAESQSERVISAASRKPSAIQLFLDKFSKGMY